MPAFVGLGAPHWDPHARGTDHRPDARDQAGHIARAALESIAFQVADVLEAMHSETGTPLSELRVDGGAAVNNLLMQFQADLLGVPVVRPRVTETTALGAAYLAGLAVGLLGRARGSARQAERRCALRAAMDRPKRRAGRAKALAARRRTFQWLGE